MPFKFDNVSVLNHLQCCNFLCNPLLKFLGCPLRFLDQFLQCLQRSTSNLLNQENVTIITRTESLVELIFASDYTIAHFRSREKVFFCTKNACEQGILAFAVHLLKLAARVFEFNRGTLSRQQDCRFDDKCGAFRRNVASHFFCPLFRSGMHSSARHAQRPFF